MIESTDRSKTSSPAGSFWMHANDTIGRLVGSLKLDPGLIVVAALILIAVSPLLQQGLPNVADAPIHLFRTAEWVRSWQAGILVPRWSPTLAYGYGYPLFIFAPPLPYALAGTLHLIGFSLEASIKVLIIGCFAVAGFGTYLLARSYLNSAAAIVAAAAYLFAPFLLREAYLYGGNYPQLLAISLYPAILWAFHRLMQTGRPAFLLLSTGLYGALMLSHNFHALIFTPLLGLFILGETLLPKPSQVLRRLLRAIVALLLGLGWTAYFWLPAFLERQWTRAQEDVYMAVSPIYLRFLHLRDLVAVPQPLDSTAANPYMPFTLGPVIVILAGAGALVALLRPKRRWPALLFLAVLGMVAFMLLPASEWLWTNIPLLALAEFPWRLLGMAALSCAFLAGGGMLLWPSAPWARFVPAALILLIILGSAVYLYPPKAFVTYGPTGTPTLADQARYERATGTIGTTTLSEYLPLWVQEVPSTSPLMPDLLAGRPYEKLDREALPAGVEARLLEHTPNSDRYAFSSDEPFSARFYTFHFPGWQAEIDGQLVEIDVTEPYGLIEIPIPAGEHELNLHFGETLLRAVAGMISLLSLAATVTLAIVLARRPRPESQQADSGTSPSWSPFVITLVVLLVLLAGKALLVDAHTSWFRRQSPPGEVIGASHPAQVNLDGQVMFLGYDLDRNTVKAGQRVRLTLYWQALEKLQEDYNVFAHLDAPPYGTTMLAADNDPPGDAQAQTDIPTTHWELESYVRDEHRFTIPADLPPLRYTLRVGLYDPATGGGLGKAIELQDIQVLPSDPIRPSEVPNRLSYRLGEEIDLLGYKIEDGAQPELNLYWRAKESVGKDYSIFVHIVDEGDQTLDQRDGPPLEGMYPTSAWWPGQIVVDQRALPELPASGQLLVGLYELATMQRLPAYDGDGRRLPNDAIPLPIEP